MPRTKRIEKEDILRAAVQVVRTQGEGALSVRGIAKELGCSTQPLYSEFGSMEELRAALTAELDEKLNKGAALDDADKENLRNNLGPYRDYIVTLRGVGYKFEYEG